MVPSFLRRLSNGSTQSSAGENHLYTKSWLHHLVSNSKWSRLRIVLETPEGQSAIKESTKLEKTNDISILHELLANDPPIDIFDKIILIVGKEQLKNPDFNDFGRNPFHKALTNRADYELVKRIVTVYPEIACSTDDTGVTPLMIECSMGKICDYRIVKLLVRTAPNCVMSEDIDGCSALEYALMSSAIDVFKRLQHYHAHELRKQSEADAEKRRIQFLRKHTSIVIAAQELSESFAKLESATEHEKSRRLSRGSRAA